MTVGKKDAFGQPTLLIHAGKLVRGGFGMDDGKNPSTVKRLIPPLLSLAEFEAERREGVSPVTLALCGFGCFGERGPEVNLLFEPRPDIVARQQASDRDTSHILGSQSGNLALKASRCLVGW